MIPTVIFLKGSPGTGRSEWAKQWSSEACNRVRISVDDIVSSMSSAFPREKQSVAYAACLNILINSIKTELNVCVDAEHRDRLEYQRMEATAKRLGAEVIWKIFPDEEISSQ